MILGQINIGSPAGEVIRKISSREDVDTIVEIGTWNGAGSTRCVIDALRTNTKAKFYSLECNKGQFELAKLNNPNLSNLPNVNLIFGRIVNEEDLDILNLNQEEVGFLAQDVQAMRGCSNVIELLPSSISFLILDGGEFSTQAEFKKLIERTNFIFLDDTRVRKNKKNRQHLIESDEFIVLEDHLNDRNGWSLFKRK
jgi:hypothetical protein